MLKTRWTRPFGEIGIDDVPVVGGKNASLGEMTRELGDLGVRVPDGYAVTADAYRHFLDANDLTGRIRELMAGLDEGDVEDLTRRSSEVRNLGPVQAHLAFGDPDREILCLAEDLDAGLVVVGSRARLRWGLEGETWFVLGVERE